MREMQAPLDSGSVTLADLAGGADGLPTVNAELLFTGEFARIGDDLQLTGSDGASLTIEDYFATEAPVALVSPQGAMLTGDVVQALSGGAPVQLAQSGEIASDAQPVEAGTAIGHVESFEGLAQVKRSGSLIDLEVGDPVYQGDVLTTGGGSALGIVFIDDTVFAMGANGRMVLDNLVYNPGASDNSMLVNLVHGSFVFVSGEVAPTGGITVETPVASIGIRGTMVSLTIKAINGETEGSLLEEPDGELGSYGIYDKQFGQLIGLLEETGSLWTLTSVTSTLRYHAKTQFDFVSEMDLVNFATTLHYSSRENRPGASTRPIQRGQRSSGELGDDVLETAAGPGLFGSGGSSFEASNDYQNSVQSLTSVSPGFGTSRLAASSTLDTGTPSAGVPTPAPATAFASVSSAPPPPPPPAPDPAAPSNSAPTAITLDNASVDEESDGAVVGTLTVADPDSGESFIYAVSDDRFEVVDGQLRLSDGEALDYETEQVVPLTITVTDSAGNAFAQDFEIAVNDQADPPVVDLNGPEPGSDFATSFTEGEGPIAVVGAGAGISDDDSANLTVLTATITNLSDGAAESLAVSTVGTAVTADYNSASGVLTLTDGASLAEYQQVLSTLTYENTSDDPTAGVRTIEVVAEDSSGLTSSVATASVAVSAENDPPVLVNNSLTIGEGGSVVLTSANLSATDADGGEADLLFTVSGVQGGQFERLSAPGTAITTFTQGEVAAGDIRFIHDGGETPPTYDVTVSDGDLSDNGAAAITFTPVNDPPILVNNGLTIAEGESLVLSGANLSAADPDNTDFTYAVSGVQAGQFELISDPGAAITSFTQAQLDAGQVLFVHDGSETAPSYLVSVSDGDLATDPAPAAITFNGLNEPPVVDLNGADTGIGYSAIFLAGEGPVGAVDPGATVADADSANLAGLTITLTNPLDGTDESLEVGLEAANALGITVTGNGTASLTLSGAVSPANYQELLHTLTYDNSAAEPTAETRTIEIQADDGGTGNNLSLVAVASITVTTAEAQPPVLTVNQMTLEEGGIVELSADELAASDPDSDDAALIFTASGVTGGQFELLADPGIAVISFTQVQVTSGEVRFVHDGGEAAPAYQVSVSDGALSSGPSAAAIDFTNVNDAPQLTVNNLTVTEGATVPVSTGNLNASDPDSATLTFLVSGVQNGQFESVGNPDVAVTSFTLAEVAANQVQFAHDGGELAPAYLVSVSDGEASSGPAPAVIEFIPINDPPVAVGDTVMTDEDTAVIGDVLADNGSGTDSDPDGDPLTVSAVNGVAADVGSQVALASGALLTLNADGTFSYDPNGQFEALGSGDSVLDSFSYTISDGNGGSDTATVTIVIDGVNDAPEVANETATVVKGAELAITPAILSASDAETSDPALITFTVSNQVAGTILLSGLAATSFTLADVEADLVTFQHDDSDGAEAGFTVVAGDPDGGASVPVAVTFTVSAGFIWTNGAGDGDWHNPANWASNSVPGDGAAVVIEDQAGEVTYSTGTLSLSSLTLAGETLNVTDGTLTLTDFTWSGGGLAGTGGIMTVGGTATLTGPLTLDHVLMLNGTGELSGAITGSGSLINSGSLTVDDTASLAVTFANLAEAELLIDGGVNGAASLTISGAFAQQGVVTLTASSGSGDASLTVTEGSLVNQGVIVVEAGAGGARSIEADLVNVGEMTFNAATAITGADAEASNETGGLFAVNADVTLSGAASFRNSGTMTVAAAATFALVAADFENAVGGIIGGGGTIDVDGSLTNNGTINPGASPGVLTVNGDFVQGTDGELIVEIDGSGNDLLTVTGTASFAGTVTIVLLDGYTPVDGETFTFITAGSIVDNDVTVTGLAYAGGQFGIQLSGGAATLVAVGSGGDVFVGSNEIIVGDTGVGSLTVDAGQTLTTQYFSVGEEPTGSGTFILTNGSELTVQGPGYIGNFGEGQATISGGAQAQFESTTFNNLVVAAEVGSTGSLLIDGEGTTVTTVGLDNSVQVGFLGEGELTVQGGAALNTLWLEAGRGGSGTITIQGDGTEVTVSNDDGRFSGDFDYEAGYVRAGRHDGSTGTIQVLDGARLEIRNGEGVNEDTTEPGLSLAYEEGSVGNLLIDGEGSIVELTQLAPSDTGNGTFGPFLQVGRLGEGNMTVSGGADISLDGDAASFTLGRFVGGQGTALIDGPGSSVSLAGNNPFVSIGREGSGDLTVRNGSSISVLGSDGFVIFEVGRENGATGLLALQSGAQMLLEGANDQTIMRIGRFAGSGGEVVIEGSNTLLEVRGAGAPSGRGDGIRIGEAGVGHLETRNGATLLSERVDLGHSESGVGTALVDNASWEISSRLWVGRLGEGTLTIQNGGSVALNSTDSLRIGVTGGSSGTVNVEGNSQLTIGSELVVGSGEYAPLDDPPFGQDALGLGTLNVNGGSISSQGAVVGDLERGVGTVAFDGGAWQNTGELIVGNLGAGQATISGGADALFQSDNFDNLLIGAEAGSTGSLVVAGAGTTVTTAGFDNTVQAGMLGTGTLLVEDGASLATLFLEAGREGQGTITIQGAGTEVVASSDTGRFSDESDFAAGFVRAGAVTGSQGTIQVLDGARLEIRNGIGVNEDTREPGLQIARDDGSVGSVLIDGAGSVIEISQTSPVDPDNGIFGPFVQIGRGGDGSMTIQNAGQLSMLSDRSTLNLGRDATGQGSLSIDGPGSTLLLSGDEVSIQVGRDGVGSLSVASGGQVVMAGNQVNLSIGNAASTTSTLLIDGSQSSFTMSGVDPYVGVGQDGHGVLALSNDAVMLMDGPGISLEIAREDGAVGMLAIQSGAELSIHGRDGDSLFRIGRFVGSEGSVIVEGTGSLLSVGGTNLDASFNNRLEVGRAGSGQLTVRDGGLVIAEQLRLGAEVSGVGVGLVDNANWEIGAGGIFIGHEGDGTLTIQNDGTASVDGGFSSIAHTGGSTGVVNVDATSSFNVAGFLSVGNGYYNPVDNPGLGQDATAFGTLSILGGTVTAQEANVGGELRGDGTVLIDGSGALFQVAETLTIAAAGVGIVTVGNGGTLQVGAAQGDGIADIFINSGGTLEILAGGTVIGDIDNDGGTFINGNSPGTANFGGDFVMTDGTLEVELAGTGAGAFDLYQVAGGAVLQGGLIEFSLLEGYDPVAGDFFGFFTAGGGLTVGDDLSYAFLGVAEGFDFEVSFSDDAAGLVILNDAGAGDAMVFLGGAGEDVFVGGSGNDRLDGGVGQDSLTGGAGADLFVLRGADAAESLALADIISDFEVGTDSFDLADGLAVEDLAIATTASGDAALVLQSSGAALAVLQGVSAAELSLAELTAVA